MLMILSKTIFISGAIKEFDSVLKQYFYHESLIELFLEKNFPHISK